MSTSTLSTFFALLSLLCWAATLGTASVLLLARRADASPAVAGLADAVRDIALWMAWIVAAVTAIGSLYYSLVAHYEPCELCWYQRICMYPLAAVLLVAALRRDGAIWRYVVPQCVVGVVIAVYHTQLQAFPDQHSFCRLDNPCTTRYVWEFGFVSLPFMSLAAFSFILVMLAASASRPSQS